MASTTPGLHIGPLASTTEVVAFLTLTGMAWFNAIELLWTIFVSFQRWTGRYFSCLVVATLGVFLYQVNVFFMIFAPSFNPHAVIACIGIGWSAMVTGQSLVLWSRLHLVCRSQWKLNAILYMIIIDGVGLHGPQFVFSLLAIKNGAIDPTYKPFEIMEKIAIAVFTVQELIISGVYLSETVRILKVGELVQKKSNRRRIQMLFLANVAIIAIDVTTVTLEFLALWGVWCSFKGFGYSVKLKIEFAILNQLRDSVKSASSSNGYGQEHSDKGISLSSRALHDRRSHKPSKPSGSVLDRQTFSELGDHDQNITKTIDISVQRVDDEESNKSSPFMFPEQSTSPGVGRHGVPANPPSKASSEIEFANRGL
ncbi:hypothetical protein K505DRAFT_364466 [Melanomma pulvis-pyrius CBS 109.77]|uniref:DUF7703 domain-containing protein n=1 Tax=Melanomma pulvis-pyrius CBS 109.77 TaxID=1314802 RepID=A0A6A6X2I1_9PLEO|nr:hypothetical protein K505DRAFT_364466 [Melanomma pulvis-pyrius CBS 109.77]